MNARSFRIVRYFLSVAAVFYLSGGAFADELTVHYHRPDADYDGWTLWTWNPDTQKNKEISPAPKPDEFGLVFRLNLRDYGEVSRIGILPKYKNWESKDDPDRFWTSDMGGEVYLLSADKDLHSEPPDVSPRVLKAMVDDTDRVRIVLSKGIPQSGLDIKRFVILDGQKQLHSVRSARAGGWVKDKIKTLDVTLAGAMSLDGMTGGTVAYDEYKPGPMVPGKILDQPVFYSDAPLGATYSADRTVFRVFAPTALSVSLALYDQPAGGDPKIHPMSRSDGGVWEAAVEGDQIHLYYTYRANFIAGEYEVVDPYAKSTTAHHGRGMVIEDKTPVAPSPVFDPADAIIYELHIRDFTIDPAAGVPPEHRGKYLGLTAEGTRYADDQSITTALDHLKELGVNVVQIMPFHDFDNTESSEDYNWGYMPFHYFSPDGWFATRRDDATRVREAKQMIDAFHRGGIKVVLDVVYNHTAEGNPNIRVSFNGLAPNYYYRQKEDGSYWNGSGCGNEFRSESPMGRKLILDSVKYWVSEYGIDGFRFDLMGLMDLETVREIVREVRKIKPDALIYGEPWAGGSSGIRVTSKGDQRGEGFSVFNDHFRDAIKGSAFSRDPAFVQDGRDVPKIKRGILGSIDDFAKDPVESINYAEAHDNHTLWDRLELTTRSRPDISVDDRVSMDKLTAALVLTSQGIPFIQAGQEMLRTKEGDDNSYNKPDRINMIHWRWKKDHKEVYDYYRGLIRLRRNHPMFRMGKAADVKKNLFFLDDHLRVRMPEKTVGYILHRGPTADDWVNALVLFNANDNAVDIQVPGSSWIPAEISADAEGGSLGREATSGVIRVPGYSASIFYNRDENFYSTYLNPKPVKAPSAAGGSRTKFSVAASAASRVTVAGSFNDWKMDAYPLEKQPDGSWTIELDLAPGPYEYKFIADGDWDRLNKENRKMTVKAPSAAGGSRTKFSVAAPAASMVTVAGSFNDWKMDAYPLEKQPDGSWMIELDLPAGAYEYKFISDGDWDKLNPQNRKITVP